MDLDTQQPNQRLRHARLERGWSQQRVAEQLDTSENVVSRWERGERVPSPFYQEKLCKLFGKNAEELGFLKKPTGFERGHKYNQSSGKRSRNLVIESDGCFSFGKLKTTGIVLDGDGIGIYLPQHIRSRYTPVAEELPEELQAKRNQIQQEQEQKREQGLPFLWNGEIYSLDRFVISREPIHENMTLDLWFRPSDYYTFQATNMSLDDPTLREKYLKDPDWYETIPYFSNSFGTSLVVITADGYTFLTQRSSRQGSNAGYYSISANEGLSRPLDRGTQNEAPDLYRCASRGLFEELGLHEPADFSVADITYLTFEVDTQYALWGILGMVKIQRTVAELFEIWQRGVRDKMENKKVVPVLFTPPDVCSLVFAQRNWTPGGLICLYHALVHEFGRREVDVIVSSY